MIFNSIQFIFFFVFVTIVYFLIPHRSRIYLLLFSSYFFYMCWNTKYILLLFVFTLGNYLSALLICSSSSNIQKNIYLSLSLFLSFGLLFLFKYYVFFLSQLEYVFPDILANNLTPELGLLLPVGISFYTFQTISYTIDVYRGVIPAEKHFGRFALYVSFFPQLVAGPIERASHLLSQFSVRHYFDYSRVKNGLLLILWGLFQKVVVADRLAIYVDAVYNNPGKYFGLSVWLATMFFSFQIYCDFSGYTDIARGSAKILGIELMHNFRRPYLATTIREFWRRWHISLSTWLRDYLYIPLGGNRVSRIRGMLNIFVVFLLCGLWHGANWNFVVWGGLHGLFIIFAIITVSIRRKIRTIFKLNEFPKIYFIYRVSIVFSLVSFGWIFFRANSINDAVILIRSSLSFGHNGGVVIQGGLSYAQMILSIVLLFILCFVNFVEEKTSIIELLNRQCIAIRWTTYFFLVFIVIIFGVYDADLVEFIYFQF